MRDAGFKTKNAVIEAADPGDEILFELVDPLAAMCGGKKERDKDGEADADQDDGGRQELLEPTHLMAFLFVARRWTK